MKTYRHTQIGWAIVLPCGAIGFALLINFSSHPPLWLGAVVLLVGAILFCTLTITIEDDLLGASFGPGLIRKKVRLTDIASVRPIRVRWWYGWGIRLTPQGWLYSVSGWKAVEINLRDGRQFCLGTDEPENLLKAIRESSV